MTCSLALRVSGLAALFCLATSSAALAQTAAAPPPTIAPPNDAPLAVELHGDLLPNDLLEAALRRELPRSTTTTTGRVNGEHLTLTWRRSSRELAVSYDNGAQTITRVVSADDDPARVADDAALLAANLLREDVASRPAPPPAPTSAPAPAPAPPPPKPRTEPLAYVPAVASFAYPLATNLQHPWARTNFEFNALYGRVGALEGLQLGMFGMVLGNRARGASGDVLGAQISALANVATGHVRGAQTSASNIAVGGLSGAQIGGVNVVGDRVRGVQIGGINVAAGPVQGVQVGLVNYAKDVEGVPIGLVSVTKSGGVHPTAWWSSATYGNLGVKFATRYTYTMPYGSMHHAYNRALLGGGFAVGARVPILDWLRVELDVGMAYMIAPMTSRTPAGAEYNERLLQPRVRAALHVSPLKHLTFFAGGGAVAPMRFVNDDLQRASIRPEVFAGLAL